MVVLIVLGVILAIVGIICAVKESDVSGFYKDIGLFGRVKAYLIFAGILGSIAGFVISTMSAIKDGFSKALPTYIASLIVLAIGVILLITVMKRCAPEARAMVLKDICVVGLGLCIKIGFFFLMFLIDLWILTAPKKAILSDGREVYVNGNKVYDSNMNQIGTYNHSTETATVIEK